MGDSAGDVVQVLSGTTPSESTSQSASEIPNETVGSAQVSLEGTASVAADPEDTPTTKEVLPREAEPVTESQAQPLLSGNDAEPEVVPGGDDSVPVAAGVSDDSSPDELHAWLQSVGVVSAEGQLRSAGVETVADLLVCEPNDFRAVGIDDETISIIMAAVK